MRYLLLVLLIATFPLRGFASAGMETSMGLMSLHQASIAAQAVAEAAANPELGAAQDATQIAATPACCAQCNSCDLCHLLLQQAPAALALTAVIAPPAPVSRAFAFASADVHRAHKPPLA